MKRLTLIAVLALAACSQNSGPSKGGGPRLKPAANPGAVIAAELGFNQLAQEKGQWTAFRETAAPEAEMFVPHRVKAADWLKDRADPPLSVKWQPHSVWSSCDGSFAVTQGTWQRPGSTGSFATVWQRQAKSGDYKWALDMSIATEQAVGTSDTVAAKVADCKAGAPLVPMPSLATASDAQSGASDDRTLQWISWEQGQGGRQLTVFSWNGTTFDEVLRATTPLPTR